ncbi:peptide-methionine (R)-S-oxide reductase MsrB [Chitinivorax sp. B]|uniref:peptide-methionine (R)-S-oxide reductase MsrB n=1 Tax=Chitinivorax sp. B TaxID=2502235 RepID=UPI0010F4362D|nr:peptide-methionine (R)-S-oxide reductase MsrB [Chitinivorax sp. B]
MSDPTNDKDWRAKLSPDQYRILRECGTEPPFSGKYYHHHELGTYRCAGCGAELFSSDSKYESGSGWPSFFSAMNPAAIRQIEDHSHGMHRTEIRCAKCDGHLGHVFPDGPAPTGLRYCVNSVALDFSVAKQTD